MTDPRPPYGLAALLSAALLGLYALTLAPTTGFWDASEYIATAHILGIPHPPGNPLFVVLGRAWELLLAPTGLSVAVRINLLAAVTTAVSCGLLFLVAWRVLVAVAGDGPWARTGAAASGLISGTAYTVWNQATVNEKVYTISVLVILAATWLAFRWYDRRGWPGSVRYPLAIVFLLVLGSTNHLMSVLPAGALLVMALLTRAEFLRRRDFWVRALPLAVVGLSFNFFLPIRAAQDPAINEGDPVCESALGAAAAVYTQGRAGCPALASSLTREQYGKPPVTERQAEWGSQLLNYWQYFEWQWGRGLDPSELPGGPRLPLALAFLGLGLWGLWVTWKADRILFAYLATLAVTLTVGLVWYLNFRYGYSLAPEVADRNLHEVRERDYFFVASCLLWGGLAGIGLAGAWKALAGALSSVPRPLLATAPVLAVALVPGILNAEWASRRDDHAARDWAYDLLMSAEPYAVLFTHGDNDTFPLWYLQEVEGLRQDVTVVVASYLYTGWYADQLRTWSSPCPAGGGPENDGPCQRLFEPDEAPAFYEAVDPPDEPVLSLGRTETDRVGSGRLPRDFTLPIGDVAVSYPAGTWLDRSHRLALAIIHDSIGDRPVYFVGSSGLMRDLGLEEMGVRHGLLTRLAPRPDPAAAPDASWVRLEPRFGSEWLDLDRSLALAQEVYRYRGLRDREVWADRSTLDIPWHFYVLHVLLAAGAEQAGLGQDLVESLLADADAFLAVARGGTEGTPAGE